LDSRSKWEKKTEEFEEQSRDPISVNARVSREPESGKVFVRADLNPSCKRET
jgi:hypothetical protein